MTTVETVATKDVEQIEISTRSGEMVYDLYGLIDEDVRVVDEDVSHERLTSPVKHNLELSKMIGLDGVNLETWFRGSWKGMHIGPSFDLEDGRSFRMMDNPEPQIDLIGMDVRYLIRCARTRAAEDGIPHGGYVLASWVYLASRADHVRNDSRLRVALDAYKDADPNFPQDVSRERSDGGYPGHLR